jgi:glycerate dehydrogenase
VQIVFLDRATFAPQVVFDSTPIGACRWQAYPMTAPGQIVERARAAEVVVVNKVRLEAAELAALPALKLVALTATGTDNVDLAAAAARGVAVANVRDYAGTTVPEHVFALALALRRNLLAMHRSVRAGRWSAAETFCLHDHPIADLAGGTLGIVGAGTLGQAVGRLGECFGMRVLYAERRGAPPRPGRVTFEQALAESDVLSLHLPLTAETRHLIGARELARMKPDAILINTARGALVEPVALIAALRAGRLGGAGIDVLETEPPPAEHPLLAADLPNLIVTPHIAWASRQAQQRLADEVIANIAAFARGEARNRVV